MKRIILTLAGLFVVFGIFSQTVDHWCVDGRIYFKIKNNVDLNLERGDKGKINPKDLVFLNDIVEKYQVSDLRNSFYTADSKVMRRTLRMDFDKIYKIDELLKEMNALSQIEYAEKAPLFRISHTPNDPLYDSTLDGGLIYGSAEASWHLDLINAETAWDITTGDSSIVVAILDNAIYVDHPDLQNKIVEQVDLGNDDNDPNPPDSTYIWSHGTHGAGLIGAETNNNYGISSIGYDVGIMAVKLGDDASGGQAMAAGFEGIVWAADHGADVINMSWGSPQYFITMQNTINYAYNKGCVMLGAAGNNGNGMETQMDSTIPVNYVGYPAALDHVIAVGSCDVDSTKSNFSNYGEWIDVLSPGGFYKEGLYGLGGFSVLSTTANQAGGMTEVYNQESGGAGLFGVSGNYDIMQGTSMASPVAAGLCGLMLSANPDLTPEELTEILKVNCIDVDAQNPSFVDSIGAGIINAAAAVQAAQDSIAPLVADFEASEVVISPGDTISFTDLTTGSPNSWTWNFEGAIPSMSTIQNPSGIVYDTEGVYKVKLTASDGTNTDAEEKTMFIIVNSATANSQTAWIPQNTRFPSQYRGVSQISTPNDSTAWILTYDGSGGGSITRDFARTNDGGTTWMPDTISAPDTLSPGCISAVNDMKAWVALYNQNGGGAIYHTDDGGDTWSEQASASFSGGSSFPNVIHMFNENEGFCMGDPLNGEFEVYTTSDGGSNWTLVDGANLPDPQTDEMGWTGVFDAVGDTAWFGTNKGRIYKTADKGATWNVQTTGEDNVSRISMTNGDEGFIIAQVTNQQGQVESWAMRKTTDGGNNWDVVPVSAQDQPSDISAVPGHEGMIISVKISQTTEQNFSAYSMDYGATWTEIDDSVQYTCVEMLNENTGWAGGFNLDENIGGIYKWPGIAGSGNPYFTSSPVTSVTMGDNYTYNIVAEDPDSLPLTITGQQLPPWLTLTDNGNGTALLTGTAPDITTISRDDSVSLEVSNGNSTGNQNFNITINTSNQAPSIISTPVTSGTVGIEYEYTVEAEDPENDTLAFTLVDGPSWMNMADNGDGTALLFGVPVYTSIFGLPVEISVSDGMFGDSQSFSIGVDENSVVDFGRGVVDLYPNPSDGKFILTNCQNVKFSIYTVDGKLIKNGLINNAVHEIKMNAQPAGFYMLKLQKENQKENMKIQIIK